MANLFSTLSPKSSTSEFLERMSELPGKRTDDFMEQTRRYREGEIGLEGQLLQGAANAVGMLTDIPFAAAGEAVGALTPEFIQKGIQDLIQGISETEAAQVAMRYAQENPEVMKRLGYAADLSVIPAARAAKSGMLQDLSMEASNRQPWFYGKGLAGKAASIGVTGPTAVIDTLRPSAAASRRAGVPMSLRRSAAPITPERRAKAADIRKIKKDNRTQEEQKFLDSFDKDLSFVEGQLDQTQLLSRGRGIETQGVVKSFENVQQLAGGKLSPEALEKSSVFSKAIERENMQISKNNLAVLEERIRKAQGMSPNEDVEVVIRNPKAFSDIGREISWEKAGSSSSKRIMLAKKALQRHFPDQKEFTDEELREFVAMTKLPDDTIYNLKTKKEASLLEKQWYRLTESEKYGRNVPRRDSETIDMYYKYKKMEQEGQRLRKPQQEIYDGMKGRVRKTIDNLDVRGDTVYFSDSHVSAAKGLGGVNNQFMVNRRGDFLGVINDENDLFGKTVPGDKRVLSVAPPEGMNVFKKAAKTAKEEDILKTRFQQELQAMGAEPVAQTQKGLLEQAAVGIQRQPRPGVRPEDFRNLAAAGALTTGTARER